MRNEIEPGDRVKGLYAHKGKTGYVLSISRGWVTLQWDGGKRSSTVEKFRVEKDDE
jgi:hypothetical protein